MRWEIVVAEGGPIDEALVGETRRLAPVTLGGPAATEALRNADVVIAWLFDDLALLERLRRKLILVAHCEQPWETPWWRLAAPLASRHAAVSEAAARVKDWPGIEVLPNGADPEQFTPRRSRADVRTAWGLDDDDRAVLYVGRLAREKGCVAIAHAVQELGAGYRAVFLGRDFDAGCADEIRAACPTSMLLGIDHPGDAYAAADVAVVASEAEGGPLVALEAIAAGVPLASTLVGMMPAVRAAGGAFEPLADRSPAEIARGVVAALARFTDRTPRLPAAFTAEAMAARWAEFLLRT